MAGDTAAIIQVIDICIVSDRSVRPPGVLNIPPTSYLAPNCLHTGLNVPPSAPVSPREWCLTPTELSSPNPKT